MIIASSEISMQSSHLAFSRTEVSERLEMWVGPRPARAANPALPPQAAPRAHAQAALGAPSARVSLSAEGLAAQSADEVQDEMDPLDADPRLKLLATMIEMLTGRALRTLRLGDFTPASKPGFEPPAGPRGETRGGAGAGFGIEYEFNSTRIEYEHTRFQASGTIRTADGQEIRFEVAFAMERSFMESTQFSFRAGDARLKDPLVLDFGGPAAALQNTRFAFDLDGDGELDQVPLLGGGRGFLAIDRNGNGQIDSGKELFGPTSGDGFAELAALDADGNGWIDAADPAWAQLRLWQPSADGLGSLQTLDEAGVGALYLSRVATPFDLRNGANETLGVMRSSGVYVGADGRVGTVSQIDLSV